jgi:hypothetical protein
MNYVKDLEILETVREMLLVSLLALKCRHSSSFGHCGNQRSYQGTDSPPFCRTSSTTLLNSTGIIVACLIVSMKYSEKNILLSGVSLRLFSMLLSIGGMLIWSISLIIRLQHSGSKTNVQTTRHSRHSTMYVSDNYGNAHKILTSCLLLSNALNTLMHEEWT